MSSLSTMPPKILSGVLSNRALPLRKRLRLRLLSNRWADVIEEGLAKETSLVIRENAEDWHGLESKPDHLVIPLGGLHDDLIQVLTRLFPETSQLTLNFQSPSPGDLSSWSNVPSLLANFATNLTTIALYGHIDEQAVELIADSLDNLSGLTSLTLHGWDLCESLLPHLAPVLFRLKKLSCPYAGELSTFYLLTSFMPQCTHLILDFGVFDLGFNQAFRQLSDSLTHLHLVACSPYTDMRYISKLTTLTSLTLGFSPQAHISSFLRPLTSSGILTDVTVFNVYWTPDNLPFAKAIPMPSVKRLTMQIHFNDSVLSHFEQYRPFFNTIAFWFSTLDCLTLFCVRAFHPALKAPLGEIPFTVKVLDYDLCKPLSFSW